MKDSESQLKRLIIFLIVLFNPWLAIAYVYAYHLDYAQTDIVLELLAIITLSVGITVLCSSYVIGQLSIDLEKQLRLAGQINLALVVFEVFAFVVLSRYGSPVVATQCIPDSDCRQFPVRWIAFAGMSLCYYVWSVILLRKSAAEEKRSV